MGLFDFWRRKATVPSSTSSPPATAKRPAVKADDDDLLGPSHHYALAHLALREIALGDPLQYLSILASPRADSFLEAVLKSVSGSLGLSGRLTVADLKVHTLRIDEFPCAIVEMPPPHETAEAFFTGLIVLINVADDIPEDGSNVPARYFTLEKGFSFDETPRTVFAEWNATTHFNLGEGPQPTLDAFARKIAETLK